MSSPGGEADKLVDLELKLGFMERTLEELNEVLIEQAGSLERLERRMEQLAQRVAGKLGDADEDPPDPLDERPPHY